MLRQQLALITRSPADPWFPALLLGLGIVLAVSACGYESRVAKGNAEGVMHVALSGEPQTLDPDVASGAQEFILIAALMEPLVSMDTTDLSFIPGAAKIWSFDEDGLGATFYLQEDAHWSNGDPVTARDFVFAWRRAVNPRMGNQVAEVLFALKNAKAIYHTDVKDLSVLGVTAVDAKTLRLEFEYPVPPEAMLLNLTHPSTIPLHEASVRAHDGHDARYSGWAKPGAYVSNGPFSACGVAVPARSEDCAQSQLLGCR